MGVFKRGLVFEAKPSANQDEYERIYERPWGMFYRGPTVGAKCSYQNPELAYVRVDVAEEGSSTSHIGFKRCLYQEDKRGDLQNKNTSTLK